MTTIKRVVAWGVDAEGSSRSAALIRIGLAFLIWSRFGYVMLPLHDLHGTDMLFRAAFFGATLCMAVGFRTGLACAASALALGVIYFHYGHHEGRELWTAHHIYLLFIATCFITLSPSGHSYSIDRWIAVRRASKQGTPSPPESGNLLGVRLIAVQVALIYFWGAFGKATPAFLSGERLQHYFYYFYPGLDFSSLPAFEAGCMIAAITTILLEAALSVGLFTAPSRRLLMPLGIALHLTFYLLLPVLTFSLTMILLYLAFLPANRVHRWIDALHGSVEGAANPTDVYSTS